MSSSGFTMANSVADSGFPKGCGANPRLDGGVNAENCIKMRLRGEGGVAPPQTRHW